MMNEVFLSLVSFNQTPSTRSVFHLSQYLPSPFVFKRFQANNDVKNLLLTCLEKPEAAGHFAVADLRHLNT